MKNRHIIIAIFASSAFLFNPLISPAQIVLTEVMFDPAENDNYYEFVEIWNRGEIPIDLTGYRLGDGTGDDAILPVNAGMTIQSRQFGLILDPDYFGNPPIYENLIPDECLLLTVESSTLGNRGLKNSAPETVTLYDTQGIIAEYTYSIGNNPGYSDEKIDLLEPDDSTNWSDCLVLNGTPGFENSVSPDSINLTLADLSSSPSSIQRGMTATLTAAIINTGIDSAPSFEVGFYFDSDKDSILSENELFAMEYCAPLNPGDETAVSALTGSLWEGIHLFAAEIMLEDDPSDNTAFLQINVGAPSGSVILNEVMYKPLSGESEWAELYNRSVFGVNLEGWGFSDSDSSDESPLESMVLASDSYLVIAEDSSIFNWNIPPDAQVMILPGWNPLNNDGDTLYLFDAAGSVIDQLAYPSDWGNIDNGISMERINPQSSASGISNWFQCTSPSGGTPGSENSVFYLPSMNTGVELKAVPEVFSPDGDGIDDDVSISYSLPLPTARISVRIFDIKGRLFKLLIKGDLTGANGEIVWDGKGDEGKVGRIGPYIIHLEAISEPAKQTYEAKTVLILGGKL